MDSQKFMQVQRNGPIRPTDPVNHVSRMAVGSKTIHRSCSASIKLPLCFQLNTDSCTNVIMSILSQRHKMLAPITTHTKTAPPPSFARHYAPLRTLRATSYMTSQQMLYCRTSCDDHKPPCSKNSRTQH